MRHASAAGTSLHGGVLALVGDDHGAASSTLPTQSEHNFAALMMPVLHPASVQEYLDFGLIGWAMSRHCGIWVGFKCLTETVESSASVSVDPGRVAIAVPDDEPPGDTAIRLGEDRLQIEAKLQEDKVYAALRFARANRIDRLVWDSPRPRFGIPYRRKILSRRAPGLRRSRHRRGPGGGARDQGLQAGHGLAAGALGRARLRRRAGGDPGRRGKARGDGKPAPCRALQLEGKRPAADRRQVRRGGELAAAGRRRAHPGHGRQGDRRAHRALPHERPDRRRGWTRSRPRSARFPATRPSSSAAPISAPAARTTHRPRCPRAAGPRPASAATGWRC